MRWWSATTLLVGVVLVECTRKEQPTVSEAPEEALDTNLEPIQRHKQQSVELARTFMVDTFPLLPKHSELTSNYRRTLGSALH